VSLNSNASDQSGGRPDRHAFGASFGESTPAARVSRTNAAHGREQHCQQGRNETNIDRHGFSFLLWSQVRRYKGTIRTKICLR
jgi:hypothetical protein